MIVWTWEEAAGMQCIDERGIAPWLHQNEDA
jgi:hypothetical protein